MHKGNEGTSKIISIGCISIKTSTGAKLVLNKVRQVPNLHMNLSSTGELDNEGYTSTALLKKWAVLVEAKGNKSDMLYYVKGC